MPKTNHESGSSICHSVRVVLCSLCALQFVCFAPRRCAPGCANWQCLCIECCVCGELGRYKPLASWKVVASNLVGHIALPMQVTCPCEVTCLHVTCLHVTGCSTPTTSSSDFVSLDSGKDLCVYSFGCLMLVSLHSPASLSFFPLLLLPHHLPFACCGAPSGPSTLNRQI